LTESRLDVVVAGAGIAGCVVSGRIAREGYKVALVESKPSSMIGLKVCGDGVGLHDFHEADVTPPTREIERTVRGVKFYADSEQPVFTIRGKGFTLDRQAFGQRLLKEAQDQGVELFPENVVTRALVVNGKVAGVASRHAKGTNTFEASITIDATGIVGAVRSTLPPSWPVSERLERSDIGLGYREFRRLSEDFEDYCSLYYDWDVAPGGYCWIIPKKRYVVNTGLLIPWGIETTKAQLELRFKKFAEANVALRDSEFIRSEIGLVPLRHPLPDAVADGFLAIGDAACHANPLNGDGIGPAMHAAKIAAEVTTACLSRGEDSAEALWRFNVKYMQSQGYRYSANKVLSGLIRNLKSDEIMKFLKALGTRKEYSSGNFFRELSTLDRFHVFLKMSTRPTLLFRLLATVNRINTISSYCERFPEEPSHFPRWLNELNQELAKA